MTLALLADPDADTRMMYAEYLRQLTYEIDEAEDGREALAKAISRQPTVIVTETRLPGMSGFELCRLLRSDALTRPIPIIVVTGAAIPMDVKLAEAVGADGVLVKPCLPDRLAAEIDRVLSQSHELRTRGLAVRDTTDPPTPPPPLVCPACDRPLRYQKSHIGGVSERHRERWDYFVCTWGCGTFQYRQRTRRLRRVG